VVRRTTRDVKTGRGIVSATRFSKNGPHSDLQQSSSRHHVIQIDFDSRARFKRIYNITLRDIWFSSPREPIERFRRLYENWYEIIIIFGWSKTLSLAMWLRDTTYQHTYAVAWDRRIPWEQISAIILRNAIRTRRHGAPDTYVGYGGIVLVGFYVYFFLSYLSYNNDFAIKKRLRDATNMNIFYRHAYDFAWTFIVIVHTYMCNNIPSVFGIGFGHGYDMCTFSIR